MVCHKSGQGPRSQTETAVSLLVTKPVRQRHTIIMTENGTNARVFIAISTFLVGFLSATAPMKVINTDAHLFSAGNLMASGVLLSAGLVHQLPDGVKKFESTWLDGDFPIAPFIAGLAFCFFLILEEYIHLHVDEQHFVGFEAIDHGEQHHHHNHDNGSGNHNHDTHKHDNHANEEDPLLGRSNSVNNSRWRKRSLSDASWTSQLSCVHDHQSIREDPYRHRHSLEHVAEHIHGSLLASVILLLALSVHSVFDGLAIGISSNPKELISTTIAVLAHKGFAGYALGSSMVASEMSERDHYTLVAAFSCCSVIGIILGTIFEKWMADESEWKTIGRGTVNAVVAGTFLYISIVEIGLKELLISRDSKLLGKKLGQNQMQSSKLAAFLFGYLAMSSLAVFI